MTTWADVHAYLRSKYTIADEGQGYLALNFVTEGDRTQRVLVDFELGRNNAEWICISSGIGKVGEVDLEKALEIVNNRIFGAIGRRGDVYIVKHSAPLADMNGPELETPMLLAVNVADEIEAALGLGDTY